MAKKWIIGIDEVGRGPLAGPITVAAIAATGNSKHEIRNSKLKKILKGIKDSKKLSAKQREEWFAKLKACNLKCESLKFSITSVGSKVIDRIGISAAARLSVGRCLRKLDLKHEFRNSNFGFRILLDGGLFAPKIYENQKTIINGDEKIPVIAAASIIAKVHRDKKMVKLHKKFPQYGFDLHKGYGTKFHQAAIKKHGLCELHRKTFCTKLV